MEFPFDQLDPSKKLIYVSMGTLYRQDPKFFQTCFKAFGDGPHQVIISVGKATKLEDLGPIPSNIMVKNYVPQLKVLERTNAFVSHSGMNGISEAMYYNVPMLLLPKTIEQQINARRMAELGAGIDLRSQDAAPEQLRTLTDKLLTDPSFLEHTKVIARSFQETGGVKPAIDAVEKLLLASSFSSPSSPASSPSLSIKTNK